MTPCNRVLAALLLLLATAPARAVGESKDKAPEKSPNVPGMILLGEGLFAVNAGLATLDPQVFGVAAALLFPVAFAEGSDSKTSKASQWAMLIAAEGLAAYNIAALHKPEDSSGTIFVDNMIGWHVFAAIAGTTGWLAGDFDKKKEASFQYQPLPGGGMLRLAYVF